MTIELKLETIDGLMVGMTSTEITEAWQQALDERMSLPPNDRHGELGEIIKRMAKVFYPKLEAEKKAEDAARAVLAQKAADMALVGTVNVPKILYDMKLAVFAGTRAAGAEKCLEACKAAIQECLDDDKHW